MAKSLLEALPGIVAAGKRQASQILEQLDGSNRVTLQTRELVIPSKDAAQQALSLDVDVVDGTPNRLIYGDNLLAMSALLAGSPEMPSLRGQIDLIYIDPPFDSKADYRTKIALPGATIEQKPTVIEQFGYSDTWSDGTASYLAMITTRLVLMRELLSTKGSIVVHLDWHVGHYVKAVLDDVFGRDLLINEIIWHYRTFQGQTHRYFAQKHDVLYWYGASSEYTYNAIFDTELNETIDAKRWSSYIDAEGRITGANMPTQDSRFIRYLNKWIKANGRDPELDDVVFVVRGQPADTVWDMKGLDPKSRERLGYPTQKPLELLTRIVECATSEGDLVADFFAGSGTTAAAAESLGRRWIVTDLGKTSAMVIRKRLIDQGAGAFYYQAIGDYQVEQARSTLGRKFRVGELAQVVLGLYGALPLSPDENVNGSLGRLPGTKTLVFADSPAKLTTASTLRRAQQYRYTTMGGFDKVIVLGWNFSASIGQDIAALNDPSLEVLVIPPDLLDRLKKKGSEKLASELRFSTLQYLEARLIGRRLTHDGEEIEVALDNYVLLSPDAINLDEKNRVALQRIMNEEPLSLIEYWAVDPDYDGEVFRSVWQDYRGNTENDADELRVITRAVVSSSRSDQPRRVCVRAVDVFGFESEVVLGADAAGS